MVEYVATIIGLAVVMFFLIELAFNLKSEEPLGTSFMRVFQLIVLSLCLVVGMAILAIIIQVLQLQGATAPLYNIVVWIYYMWWVFIGIALLFLPLYYFFIVPRQTLALSEAADRRMKDDWKR